MAPDPTRLVRLAKRLGKVEAASLEADKAIHDALGRTGKAPPALYNEPCSGELPASAWFRGQRGRP